MKIRLKDFRQKHELFQADMAAILNIAQSTISRLELQPFADLSYNQYMTLCEKFGKEEVEMFQYDSALSIFPTPPADKTEQAKKPTEDKTSLEIIGKLTTSLIRLTEKQMELTDRLMSLIEKMERRAL